MSIHRYVVFAATASAILNTACGDVDLPPVTEGCSSTSDCPFGTVCNVQARACVAQPQDTLMGSFSCTVRPEGSPIEVGPTDVAGTVAGQNISLFGGATCEHRSLPTFSGEEEFVISLMSLDPDGYALALRLPLSVQPGDHPFVVTQHPVENFGGYLSKYDPVTGRSANTRGFVVGGTLHIDTPAAVGQAISGYVEARIAMAEGLAHPGVPCPNGGVDCGTDWGICDVSPLTDATHSICMSFCESDADCAPMGAVCLLDVELCLVPCHGNNDPVCAAPTTCVTVGAQEREVCL